MGNRDVFASRIEGLSPIQIQPGVRPLGSEKYCSQLFLILRRKVADSQTNQPLTARWLNLRGVRTIGERSQSRQLPTPPLTLLLDVSSPNAWSIMFNTGDALVLL